MAMQVLYLERVAELVRRRVTVVVVQAAGGQAHGAAAAFAAVVVGARGGGRRGGGSQAGLDEVLEDGHEEEHGDEDGRGREAEGDGAGAGGRVCAAARAPHGRGRHGVVPGHAAVARGLRRGAGARHRPHPRPRPLPREAAAHGSSPARLPGCAAELLAEEMQASEAGGRLISWQTACEARERHVTSYM